MWGGRERELHENKNNKGDKHFLEQSRMSQINDLSHQNNWYRQRKRLKKATFRKWIKPIRPLTTWPLVVGWRKQNHLLVVGWERKISVKDGAKNYPKKETQRTEKYRETKENKITAQQQVVDKVEEGGLGQCVEATRRQWMLGGWGKPQEVGGNSEGQRKVAHDE